MLQVEFREYLEMLVMQPRKMFSVQESFSGRKLSDCLGKGTEVHLCKYPPQVYEALI